MITKDRRYRAFECRADENEAAVEGYAAVFDTPEVMYEIGGNKYSEQITRGAFDLAKMQDVVMNYNHGGKPVARTKNGTLQLQVDDYGLKVRADLSSTAESRALYEEIKAGLIDKMSFAFTVNEESYDRDTRTRSILGIKRVFDVAAVDFPAYESTGIVARSFFEAEAEKERVEAREALELARAKYDFLEVE